MTTDFIKNFAMNFIVIGAGFILPTLLLTYCADVPMEMALGAGWVCCSAFTAWLMGDNSRRADADET